MVERVSRGEGLVIMTTLLSLGFGILTRTDMLSLRVTAAGLSTQKNGVSLGGTAHTLTRINLT